MGGEILIDTGPLVAYLDRRQQSHEWTVAQFSALSGTVLTCEAVISEVCFLLSKQPRAIAKIDDYIQRGALNLAPIGMKAQARIFGLMRKYHQIPMSYADACLLWLAESRPQSRLFTLDSDFRIYRLENKLPVPLIAPF